MNWCWACRSPNKKCPAYHRIFHNEETPLEIYPVDFLTGLMKISHEVIHFFTKEPPTDKNYYVHNQSLGP